MPRWVSKRAAQPVAHVTWNILEQRNPAILGPREAYALHKRRKGIMPTTG